jgi:hypothetical protein
MTSRLIKSLKSDMAFSEIIWLKVPIITIYSKTKMSQHAQSKGPNIKRSSGAILHKSFPPICDPHLITCQICYHPDFHPDFPNPQVSRPEISQYGPVHARNNTCDGRIYASCMPLLRPCKWSLWRIRTIICKLGIWCWKGRGEDGHFDMASRAQWLSRGIRFGTSCFAWGVVVLGCSVRL